MVPPGTKLLSYLLTPASRMETTLPFAPGLCLISTLHLHTVAIAAVLLGNDLLAEGSVRRKLWDLEL